MTHRAEQIMDAMTTALTGLGLTGSRVYRGRPYAVQSTEYPCLLVYMGQDDPVIRLTNDFIDSDLTVNVGLMVRSPTAQLDESLLAIREQVTTALQSAPQLGLSFVMDTLELAADEPDINGDGAVPVASMRTRWMVRYRRNRINPGA